MTSSSGAVVGGPASPGPLLLSVSGLGRIASCEKKWLLSRSSPEDRSEKSTPMALGTLMHRLIQADMLGQDWRREFEVACYEQPHWTPEYEPAGYFDTAEWLMSRYEQTYAADPLQTIAVEVPFDLPLPGMPEGQDPRVRGYIDALAKAPSGLVLVEIKTMARWGKAERAAWETQVPTYLWAARELGLPVVGCIFRAVYTYRFRGKEERPAADSFRDVWVEYSQEQVDLVLNDYRAAARRGLHLIEHPEDVVRNVGEACNWCAFRVGCVIPA